VEGCDFVDEEDESDREEEVGTTESMLPMIAMKGGYVDEADRSSLWRYKRGGRRRPASRSRKMENHKISPRRSL
jgi:hypothetical protein